jgi:hypothetical protein
MDMRRILPALSLVVVLAACGSSDDDDTSGTGGSTVPPVSETTPPGSTPTSGPPTSSPGTTTPGSPPFSARPIPPASVPVSVPGGTPVEHDLPLVVAAVDDLAQHLGIESDAVTVVQAVAVTWPDGSFGCPEPGMMYTQALVDGTFVLLEAGGRQYQYHGGDPLFLCEPGKGPFAPES